MAQGTRLRAQGSLFKQTTVIPAKAGIQASLLFKQEIFLRAAIYHFIRFLLICQKNHPRIDHIG